MRPSASLGDLVLEWNAILANQMTEWLEMGSCVGSPVRRILLEIELPSRRGPNACPVEAATTPLSPGAHRIIPIEFERAVAVIPDIQQQFAVLALGRPPFIEGRVSLPGCGHA